MPPDHPLLAYKGTVVVLYKKHIILSNEIAYG